MITIINSILSNLEGYDNDPIRSSCAQYPIFLFFFKDSLGINELIELTGLHQTTVHGLARNLMQDGFLRQDPDT